MRCAAELRALVPGADVIVVLLPLTPATRGCVDNDFLGRMRRGALLVNAGRRARPCRAPAARGLRSRACCACLQLPWG
jgi:lactate dehydrogenase-like 2-hydroxyacid dehydrogenase